MPRNACTQCRVRKIKCILENQDGRCQRCDTRDLPCSYVSPVNNPMPAPRRTSNAEDTNPDPISFGRLEHLVLTSLNSEASGLDVGSGIPAELLREGQLTQTLLLLYFSNFNDVHFMFDQTLFLRQYVLGNCPKVLLYAMMALGIRYSHAPFQNRHLQAHWGEPLFEESRRLLKEEFDHPSITTIQTYVLLATYHLAFGGTRKAWIYLNSARSFLCLLALQTDHEDAETDLVQAELSRRLVGTIALMENTLTPCLPLRMPYLRISPVPRLYSEEEFDMIKFRTYVDTNRTPLPNVAQEILSLSEIYYQACQKQRDCPELTQEDPIQQLLQWQLTLPTALDYSETNFESHKSKFALRPYIFMHLLHHHTWQMLLFDTMQWSTIAFNNIGLPDCGNSEVYQHAIKIAEIVNHLWESADLDLHNGTFAQLITVSQVILTHRLLSTPELGAKVSSQKMILSLRDCVIRIKKSCRLFNWVYNQLDAFFRVCSQDGFWLDPSWQSVVHDQMITLGTGFERLNYQTAGRLEGIEKFYNTQSYADQQANKMPEILTTTFIENGLNRG